MADWVEIANRGDETVDLSGHFLTDGVDRLDHYFELPDGTAIAAGQRLIVWCGGDGEGLHASFKLGRAEGVFLVAPDGVAVDGLLYLALEENLSLGRLPDGEGLFFPNQPTPGAVNEQPLDSRSAP